MVYQVCYDVLDEKVVVYKASSSFEAQCFINECYAMGDHSNYYIVEVAK